MTGEADPRPAEPGALGRFGAGRPDVLTWLQGWYAVHTDGDWEHAHGITIDTLDNPGWAVEIDLADTELAGRSFDRRELHRSEDDWCVVWAEESKWRLACGPLNLAEGLNEFRVWVGEIAHAERGPEESSGR